MSRGYFAVRAKAPKNATRDALRITFGQYGGVDQQQAYEDAEAAYREAVRSGRTEDLAAAALVARAAAAF